MLLYYAIGASSLASHIAMEEAKLEFRLSKVDLETRRDEGGDDFTQINPKGYVPALEFPNGELLTENIAILSWVAEKAPQLAPSGTLARIRLIETLAYISTEIHNNFKPFDRPDAGSNERNGARAIIAERLRLIAATIGEEGYVLGSRFTVADAYLFVTLQWAVKFDVPLSVKLKNYMSRINRRPAVSQALAREDAREMAPIAS
jgi:glutathione S-transferase